jgi:hypothetical protein
VYNTLRLVYPALCHVHVLAFFLVVNLDHDASLFQQGNELLHVCEDTFVRVLLTFVELRRKERGRASTLVSSSPGPLLRSRCADSLKHTP